MKKILLGFVVLILVGCSGTGSANDSKIKELEAEVLALQEKLNNFGGDAESREGITFKDKVVIKMNVLDKMEGDTLFPHQVVATPLDRDHNTPQLLTTSAEIYDTLEVGKEYMMEVYYTFVVEEGNIRFESSIIEVVK